MKDFQRRVSIHITGIVQGVGFRPTVYRYATDLKLAGLVNNTAQGVFIELEGGNNQINDFITTLKNDPPPLSQIEKFIVNDISLINDPNNKFEIIFSQGQGEKNVHISPDLATCPECISDIKNSKDRRFKYPFTNCTNCGPRFSIIKDRPYDRKLTSMDEFKMCPDCQNEYDQPLDRRFHAQPNACTTCGPQLKLLAADQTNNPLEDAITLLQNGKIAAIKGLGGFNLAVDATNSKAIEKLRFVKRRPNKSFALMMKNIEIIQDHCHLSETEIEALTSPAAPIVLLRKKTNVYDLVSPDNNYLGVILPYTPLHHLLMESFEALVFTSANKADEPIAIDDASVIELIKEEIADFGLTNNRKIEHRCDDSIVQFIDNKIQFIRRSRGFVPKAFKIKNCPAKDNLSLGANMKNTFAIRKSDEIYISQHIGELTDVRNFDYQKTQIDDLKKLLEIEPSSTNGDAHPGYENYSENNNKIFHHHAHMLSVMGEHHLLGQEVTGVICDGTGFGTDQNIWGFEFLSVGQDYSQFSREAHLKYFHLPGGERAIYEIDRIAIALTHHLDDDLIHQDEEKRSMINMLINNQLNSPLTSSLGRLFDGVAALMGIATNVEYEARAAILLQKEAEKFTGKISGRYKISILNETLLNIDYLPMIKSLLQDIKSSVSIQEIGYKFHLWIVDSIVETLKLIGPKCVVFSGGCFQNALLTGLIKQAMVKDNINFYFNEKIPTNDAGISFGQALL